MSEESIAIIDECNDKSIQEVMAAILIQGLKKLFFIYKLFSSRVRLFLLFVSPHNLAL